MLVLIVLYDTYHIEVEASVHFGSFLYITGLDVIDVDNGVGIFFSVYTNVCFVVEDDRTLRSDRRCNRFPCHHSLSVSWFRW